MTTRSRSTIGGPIDARDEVRDDREIGDRASAGRAPASPSRSAGVDKHFGTGERRVTALKEVDWDVYAGQMSLIVGPSGCGKTTLLSVIAGILDADEGVGRRSSARRSRR